METYAVTLLVLGLVALAIWSKHLRDAKLTQIRNVIHEERMKAMEKGIPFENLQHDGLTGELSQLKAGAGMHGADARQFMLWIRVSALCFSLLFIFGGIGSLIGLRLVSKPEAQGMWPLSFIPALTGFGLLEFYGLCRGHEKNLS
ncbi:MAG: hypothetical protein KJ645_02460 [Planctomycetes bacterium]|nr:hypothetical protein [Planctomycetota bacterium]